MPDYTNIAIQTDALEKFRAAVFAKHGKLRGTLAHEATVALLAHAKTLAVETASA